MQQSIFDKSQGVCIADGTLSLVFDISYELTYHILAVASHTDQLFRVYHAYINKYINSVSKREISAERNKFKSVTHLQ